MKKNEGVPFYFITGSNRMAPPEIRAVMKFSDAEIVGQKDNIIVWQLHRKMPVADDAGMDADQGESGLE